MSTWTGAARSLLQQATDAVDHHALVPLQSMSGGDRLSCCSWLGRFDSTTTATFTGENKAKAHVGTDRSQFSETDREDVIGLPGPWKLRNGSAAQTSGDRGSPGSPEQGLHAEKPYIKGVSSARGADLSGNFCYCAA